MEHEGAKTAKARKRRRRENGEGTKRLPFAQTTDARPAWWSDLRQAGLWLAFAAWLLAAALGISLAAAGVPARFRELLVNTG